MNIILLAIGLCILGLSLVLFFLYKKIATKFNWPTDVLEGSSISGIVVGCLAVLWGLFGGGGKGSERRSSFDEYRKDTALLKKTEARTYADTAAQYNNWMRGTFAGMSGRK